MAHHSVRDASWSTHLIAQLRWKRKGPHCRCQYDTLVIILDFQDQHLDNRLKTAHFHIKMTTAWHHDLRGASWNTHLQLFESTIAMEDEWPSVEASK